MVRERLFLKKDNQMFLSFSRVSDQKSPSVVVGLH